MAKSNMSIALQDLCRIAISNCLSFYFWLPFCIRVNHATFYFCELFFLLFIINYYIHKKRLTMKLPSFQLIFRESALTLQRFPFALVSAIVGSITAILLIDIEGSHEPTILFNILFAAIPGIPLMFALTLLTEKRRWNPMVSVLLHLLGIALLVGYAWSVPSDLTDAPAREILRLNIVVIALLLFASVAPFTGKGETNGFWQYNKSLIHRIIIAIVYSVILFGGLALALAAIDNLFGVHIPPKRYAELWIFIIGIFSTWFILAGVPEKLDQLDSCTEYPNSLKIFAQYALFPLVAVYLVILYAYIGKILITWDLPQGWVSRLILGFSSVGISSLLILYPFRDISENFWIRTVSRWFYVFLLPLVVVLMVAIERRISDYGLTEGRFITVVIGVWLAFIAFYFILSKTKSIKIIPASLCFIAIVTAFGPWNAFTISEQNQIERLKKIFIRDSILVEGKINKEHQKISSEDIRQISSIISYLHDIHGYDGIQPWFQESLREDSTGKRLKFKQPDLVTKMAGIEYIRTWASTSSNEFVYDTRRQGILSIEGYDRLLRTQYIDTTRRSEQFPDDGVSYRLNQRLDTLTFTAMATGDSLQISIRGVVDQAFKEYGSTNVSDIKPEKLAVIASNRHLKVKLYLQQLRIEREGNELCISSFTAVMLYSVVRE